MRTANGNEQKTWAENFLHPSEPELQAINSLEEKHTSIAHMLTEFEQSILSPESAICQKLSKMQTRPSEQAGIITAAVPGDAGSRCDWGWRVSLARERTCWVLQQTRVNSGKFRPPWELPSGCALTSVSGGMPTSEQNGRFSSPLIPGKPATPYWT